VRFSLVLPAFLAAASFASAQPVEDREKAEGFVPLFNGKDLDGWRCYAGKAEKWKAEDGLLVCTGAGGGWLGTERDYGDFVLRLEYRLQPAGNSGVYLRAPEKGHISRVGMEIQILDDDHPRYKGLDYYQYTGSLYHVVPPKRRAGKPAGQWNAMEIRCEGRRLVVVLNGVKVVDEDLDRLREDKDTAREHPGLARTTGRLGLQSHSERVEFRRLRVKELKPPAP
jgi:hypothetical protein